MQVALALWAHLDEIVLYQVSRFHVRYLHPPFAQRWRTVALQSLLYSRSVSLASDVSENTIGELASRSQAVRITAPTSSDDHPLRRIISPVVHQPAQWATSSAGYMLQVTASPLAIKFLVGKVHGTVLSHNTVGSWIRTSNPDAAVLIATVYLFLTPRRGGRGPWWIYV